MAESGTNNILNNKVSRNGKQVNNEKYNKIGRA